MSLFALVVAATATNTFPGASDLDRTIATAISEKRIPGAVLVVGHDGKVVYRKAYGNRSLEPKVEAMTLDTIFDCASLTKVVATTSCLMKLFGEGRFRLNDKLTDYIPEFQNGKSDITLRNLMTHFSGLRPDVPLTPHWTGYDTGIHLACVDPPQSPPGTGHVYSDINFILLGEVVHRLSSKTLAAYAKKNIFERLDMKDSMFQPPSSLIPRIAPTEMPLRGIVHDPTARNMGGIAGHAGLFSTGDDLAKFCQAILDGGHGVLNPKVIQKFTEPQTPVDQRILRGLGWDIDSPYSSNRGELFPIGSFGHTGFTGTSIWIDPDSKTYVILLTNSVHPTQHSTILPLRSKIATIVAANVGIKSQRVTLTGYNELGNHRPIHRNGQTKTGLDMLEDQGFKPLLGKRVGLVTNQTGIDRLGRRNVDLMVKAGVNLVSLFSPEHGFAGVADHEGISDALDASGIPIHSLYGENTRPTPEQLSHLDALVFDIQDVGARFYTYETTMAYAMEAAAKAKVPFYVLDRPNPISGTRVEGPQLDSSNTSFVGYFPGLPVRHGMTLGELAEMYNGEKKIGADLHVVQMEDWQRGDWFDSLNLPWVNPSPNMRSLKAAILYPGLCLLEFSPNFSVGRGTDAPFEQVGADFINGRELAMYLNKHAMPGVQVYPTSFTPTESTFKGKRIEGVRFEITLRDEIDSTLIGIQLACAVQALYPGKIDWTQGRHLIGSDDVVRQLALGNGPFTIQDSFAHELDDFIRLRAKYLIYR